MRVNPFELANKLIRENWTIPIPVKLELMNVNTKDNFIEIPNNKVYLGELLDSIIKSMLILEKENEDLKKDLRTVLHNNSVHIYIDPGYYNNMQAVEESDKIKDKWFKK